MPPKGSTSKSRGKRPMEQPAPEPVDPQSSEALYGFFLEKDEHKQRFQKLRTRAIVPTRYSTTEVTDAMGITENIETLMFVAGIRQLMQPERTYARLTMEFLSTLQINESSQPDHARPDNISFQLMDIQHELTFAELDEIFVFREPSGEHPEDGEFDEHAFYGLLTKGLPFVDAQRYHSKTARSSWIRNPVLRYFQRMLAHTIFARKETGSLRKFELEYMWKVLNGRTPDNAVTLIKYMENVVTRQTENIFIGGLITPIARYLDQNDTWLNDLKPVAGERLFTLAYLAHLNVITIGGDGKTLFVRQHFGPYFQLPDDHNTRVIELDAGNENFAMTHADHLARSFLPDSPVFQPAEAGPAILPAPRPPKRSRRTSAGESSSAAVEEEGNVTQAQIDAIQNHLAGLTTQVTEIQSEVGRLRTESRGSAQQVNASLNNILDRMIAAAQRDLEAAERAREEREAAQAERIAAREARLAAQAEAQAAQQWRDYWDNVWRSQGFPPPPPPQ